jgi:hypothetical protein
VIDAWFINRYEDRPISREQDLTTKDLETHMAVASEEGATIEYHEGFVRIVWEWSESGKPWVYSEFYCD